MIERVVSIDTSFDDADQSDRLYWWKQSPEARLVHVMTLRRLNYGGDRVSTRLSRVLEVAERSPR
jgi:hypothetical protein